MGRNLTPKVSGALKKKGGGENVAGGCRRQIFRKRWSSMPKKGEGGTPSSTKQTVVGLSDQGGVKTLGLKKENE